MNYTKGECGKAQLEKDLHNILRELVDHIIEIKGRKDQPEFNKGLDAICDYDEAIKKILNRTANLDMYEALTFVQKLLQEQYEILFGNYPKYGTTPELEAVKQALAKAEGREYDTGN